MKKICFAVLIFFISATPAQAKVVISEVYPAPTSEEKEWIELYNQGDDVVDLTGWKLYEHFSSKNELVVFNIDYSENINIEPNEFYVFELPTNKLNNSEEKISLENLENQEVSVLHYTNSQSKESYSYDFLDQSTISNILTLGEPTKGIVNQLLPVETPTPTPTSMPIPTVQPSSTPSEISQQELVSDTHKDQKESQEQKSTKSTKKDTKIEENIETTQTKKPINQKLNKYLTIHKQLSLPRLTRIEKEGLEKRVPQFSYLVQKNVSKQGVINAIMGGTLIIFIGFIL